MGERPVVLDGLVGEEHRVRIVWAMAEKYDLSGFYKEIKSVAGGMVSTRLLRFLPIARVWRMLLLLLLVLVSVVFFDMSQSCHTICKSHT